MIDPITLSQWIVYALIIFFVDINYGLFFISSLFPHEERAHKIKKYPKVSVIIPTKNEGHVIGEALKKLKASRYPKNKLEIIVVDANSTDDTIKIARKYANKIIIEKNPKGKPAALNTALKKAGGELIYFLDADNWVRPDTLRKLVSVMDKYNAAKGDAVIRNRNGIIEKMACFESNIQELLIYELSRLMSTEIVSGFNFIVRKKTLQKVGGFRDVLTEDINISYRLYRAGERIALVNAKCSVLVPKTLKAYWKQQERWHKGAIDEIWGALKHGKMGFVDAFVKMPFLALSAIVPTISVLMLILYIIFGHFVFLSGFLVGIMLILSSAARFDNKKELLYLPISYIYYIVFEIAGLMNVFFEKASGKKIGWIKTPK